MSELRVGVLGAGVMGSGIAQVTATAGYPTVCYDLDPAALERAQEHVTTGRYGFGRAVERGKVTQEQADAALARLEFSSSFEAAATADVVIEAVPERLDLKIRVFRDLDRVAPHDDPRVQHVRLLDRRDRGRDRPPRPRDRLALGVAGAGDALRRDRPHARDVRRDDRDRRASSHPPAARTRSSSTTSTPSGDSSPTGSTSPRSKRPSGSWKKVWRRPTTSTSS